MWVRSLGWKDPPEEEMATHSSILAWRIPWTEEPDGPQSMGPQKESDTTGCMHTYTYSVWTSPSPRSLTLPAAWYLGMPPAQVANAAVIFGTLSLSSTSNNSSSGPQVDGTAPGGKEFLTTTPSITTETISTTMVSRT